MDWGGELMDLDGMNFLEGIFGGADEMQGVGSWNGVVLGRPE